MRVAMLFLAAGIDKASVAERLLKILDINDLEAIQNSSLMP